ncbi:hypothetical protein O2W15_02175 [Modestobacter sp. VKM Ac-2979]|uniref:hypothetical protein n=1 Tax=unclassified Modestobacter TaxID=2643866 RepID=UPI0022AB9AB3|nr:MULTISPECIES: hypothetical protein [unclassified Modestobacter]MCZ2810233.1 hypothetical protein [Modestobacter sp. VKM Ac-2979]MCZ2841719.1 hypothetical protein [Modestobacter sp. VKM Ac-2980]
MADLAPPLVTGVFALAGASAGALLSGLVSRASDKRRVKAEDDRRWLADRRLIYSTFLGVIESMLNDLERVSHLLGGESKQLAEEDKQALEAANDAYERRWANDLRPAFGQLRLIASLPVVELAERLAGFGGHVGGVQVPFFEGGMVQEYLRRMLRTRDVVSELLAEMRSELGLPPTEKRRSWAWDVEEAD